MKVRDAAVRERALDTRASFCVSAPAGSGKTELLTRRILCLLAECRMPEELLAITFTRKATAEMRHRLLELLLEAQRLESLDGLEEYRRQSLELAQAVLRRDREQGWGLLQNPGRLRISTIDSLCHWLSRNLPLLSGLGGSLQSVDDGTPHRAEALQQVLMEIEEDNEIAEDFGLLLSHLDNNWQQLEKLVGGLLEKRLQWLDTLLSAGLHRADGVEEQALEALHRGVRQLRADMLERARTLLQPYAAELSAAAGRELPAAGTAAEAETWCEWRTLLLTKAGTWRKSWKKVDLPEQTARQALGALTSTFRTRALDSGPLLALDYLPGADFSADQARLLLALTRLLRRISARLRLVFRERGEVDHNEVTLAALEALGAEDAPSDLALRLDCHIRHILVDEFQDTSQAQFSLLERLVRGWGEHNAQYPETPNTLFLVGDGMQSCYGFRDANVGLFLRVREQGIGGVHLESLELQCNFRTQEQLVAWCNQNFAGVFPQATDIDTGAVPFIPAQAVKEGLEGAAAELHLVHYGGDPSERSEHREAARLLEAQQVVELVRRAQQETPQGSVAILVRSRVHALHILPALQQAGIACRTEAMNLLAEQVAPQDLLSLCCALLDPWDRFSWLAILRAPWCGLDKRALHAVAGAEEGTAVRASLWSRLQKFADLPGLEDEDRRRLERFCAAVQPAMDGRARRSLRRRVEGVWVALGGPACLQTEGGLQHAREFFSLLESLEEQGALTAQLLEQQVEQLYAAPEHPGAQVQLMTMHKAKGLEFDTVILPCLERVTRSADKELLLGGQYLGDDGRQYPLMAVLSETGAEEEPLYQWLREREKRKGQLENQRLFYIACTRAARRLHLLAVTRLEDADEGEDAAAEPAAWDEPAQGSMASILWEMHRQGELEDITFHDAALAETAPAAPALQLQRLAADWSPPPPPPSLQHAPMELGVLLAREEEQREEEEVRGVGEPYLRHTGLVLHGALERIAQTPARLHDLQWAQRMQAAWRAELRQLGVPARELDACLVLVEEGLANVRGDELGQWLLSAERGEGAAELALQYLDAEGVLRAVRVDRCFVENGERWIVDYKSARPRTGQSLEDFLAGARSRYQQQLQDYAQLFRRMEPERTVRTALYFPLLPLLHELQQTPPA